MTFTTIWGLAFTVFAAPFTLDESTCTATATSPLGTTKIYCDKTPKDYLELSPDEGSFAVMLDVKGGALNPQNASRLPLATFNSEAAARAYIRAIVDAFNARRA